MGETYRVRAAGGACREHRRGEARGVESVELLRTVRVRVRLRAIGLVRVRSRVSRRR